MSHSDDNGPKNITDQVKEILSGLGNFLPQSPNTNGIGFDGAGNWGRLSNIVLAFKCHECASMHFLGFSPDKFIEVFAGKHAKGYFENFTAIGMFQSGQSYIDLEKKIEEYEQATDGLQAMIEKTKNLADRVTIENAHLKTENDVLKRELDRLRRGGEQPGETALDYRPSRPRFKFSFGIKREGQY